MRRDACRRVPCERCCGTQQSDLEILPHGVTNCWELSEQDSGVARIAGRQRDHDAHDSPSPFRESLGETHRRLAIAEREAETRLELVGASQQRRPLAWQRRSSTTDRHQRRVERSAGGPDARSSQVCEELVGGSSAGRDVDGSLAQRLCSTKIRSLVGDTGLGAQGIGDHVVPGEPEAIRRVQRVSGECVGKFELAIIERRRSPRGRHRNLTYRLVRAGRAIRELPERFTVVRPGVAADLEGGLIRVPIVEFGQAAAHDVGEC